VPFSGPAQMVKKKKKFNLNQNSSSTKKKNLIDAMFCRGARKSTTVKFELEPL
jgi:hypothetical protein